MIKPFNGDGDVVAWLKKVNLVARIQKLDDVTAVIPLFLEGDALALYLELSEREQGDADAIKGRLIEAFAEGPFEAFNKLKENRWTGESVDVYANEIRRLVELSGIREHATSYVVKMTFVTGFPEEISKRLQQVPGVETLDVSELLKTAKILVSTQPTEPGGTTATVQQDVSRNLPNPEMACFECGGPHMRRDCRKFLQRTVCYKCNRRGHLAVKCTSSGNWRGEADAPAASPIRE